MNRRTTALLLAAALAVTACGASVLAADPPVKADPPGQTIQIPDQGAQAPVIPAAPTDGQTTETSPEESQTPAPDAAGTISFANLDSRMRAGNLSLLALEENISAIRAIDYGKMTDEIRNSLNQVANQQAQLLMTTMPSTGNPIQDIVNDALSSMVTSSAKQSLDQAYASLRETFDDLKEGKLQEDNEAVIWQLQHAQNQIVMAGEALYLALVELEINDAALARSAAALDRTVQEMELRYDFGQISALTLQEVKAGRTSLVSGQQTLAMNLTNYKTQLELLLGADLTGAIQLQPLPRVTDQELNAMDLEADLAAAMEASYDLYAAGETLESARQDFEDAGEEYNKSTRRYQYVMAQHTWEAAQLTHQATRQTFESSFRTLYLQVQDYRQVLAAAETALALEEASYAAAQLKHTQGTISKNALLTAADEVSAAQDTVNAAAIDLFSAYNNYRWAVDHGILN